MDSCRNLRVEFNILQNAFIPKCTGKDVQLVWTHETSQYTDYTAKG